MILSLRTGACASAWFALKAARSANEHSEPKSESLNEVVFTLKLWLYKKLMKGQYAVRRSLLIRFATRTFDTSIAASLFFFEPAHNDWRNAKDEQRQ